MTSGKTATVQPPGPVARELDWHKDGPVYRAQDTLTGTVCETGRAGTNYWYIKAWPASGQSDDQVRLETGLKTMAEARGYALRTPCFRCGRGRPLITMERYSPRWRCTDHEECETERAHLLSCGGKPDPRIIAAYEARTGSSPDAAAAWAREYQAAAIRLFRIRNAASLATDEAAACSAEADRALGASEPGPLRQAWITLRAHNTEDQVRAALPPNYTVTRTRPGRGSWKVMIEGRDTPGYTLEGRVRQGLQQHGLVAFEVLGGESA
jgi:hypothetical protein